MEKNLVNGAEVEWELKERDPLSSAWGGVGTVARITDRDVTLNLVRTTKRSVPEQRTFKLSEVKITPKAPAT